MKYERPDLEEVEIKSEGSFFYAASRSVDVGKGYYDGGYEGTEEEGDGWG